MKLAIYKSNDGFHPEWIEYCIANNIPYKLVDVYDTNIIKTLGDCSALMWHFSQNNPKDLLIAKQIIFSLLQSGKIVFPDFNTAWHFDDKLGQKFLLEALELPLVNTYSFVDKVSAMSWAENTNWPKVFKLRSGAGASNVKLVHSTNQAKRIVNKAFSTGFTNYDSQGSLKDTFRLYKLGKTSLMNVLKSIALIFKKPQYAMVLGREYGYVYFQDFIPNNEYDIRTIVIGDKAFAIKRMVREGDFRASGSGHIVYEKKHFDDSIISLSFECARKLKSQCVAFDFVFAGDKPLLVEISYGFAKAGYRDCTGYWDSKLNWHEGAFNPYGWMVDLVINAYNESHI